MVSYLMYGLPVIFRFLSKKFQSRIISVFNQGARQISGLIKSCPADIALESSGLANCEEIINHLRVNLVSRIEQIGRVSNLKSINPPAGFFSKQNGELQRKLEVNFSRWRSGYLYNNERKHRYGLIQSDNCRFCGLESESINHILSQCSALSTEIDLLHTKIREIWACESEQVDDRKILGLDSNGTATGPVVRNCALALFKFLQSIDYWV